MKQEGRKLENRNPSWCRRLQVKVRVRPTPSSAEALRALGSRRDRQAVLGGVGCRPRVERTAHMTHLLCAYISCVETQTTETTGERQASRTGAGLGGKAHEFRQWRTRVRVGCEPQHLRGGSRTDWGKEPGPKPQEALSGRQPGPGPCLQHNCSGG